MPYPCRPSRSLFLPLFGSRIRSWDQLGEHQGQSRVQETQSQLNLAPRACSPCRGVLGKAGQGPSFSITLATPTPLTASRLLSLPCLLQSSWIAWLSHVLQTIPCRVSLFCRVHPTPQHPLSLVQTPLRADTLFLPEGLPQKYEGVWQTWV